MSLPCAQNKFVSSETKTETIAQFDISLIYARLRPIITKFVRFLFSKKSP